MKTKKLAILISIIVIAVVTIFVTSRWIAENSCANTKSKQLSFLKTKMSDGKMNVEHNWSQKKQKVKGILASDSPDKFDEVYTKIRTAHGGTKPGYERNYKFIELKKAKVLKSLLKSSDNTIMTDLNWIERGPANVGGRTRAIVVDPDDVTYKTWFAGAVGGGVWKTSDAGSSWFPLTDDLPNIAITCLELANSNTNIMYAGTGEGFNNVDAIEGNGVMKTTDKGETWAQLASTASDPNFSYINRLAIDPQNENIVLAATNSGILKSSNGGLSWNKVYDLKVQDMRANPSNFNTLFAATSQGIIRSYDAGDTWELPEKAVLAEGRIEFAPSLSDTNRLYASVDSSPNKVFATLDGGTNWIEVDEVDGSDKAWMADQGWYDNTIGVNPYNENIVYMGGIDLWQANISTDSVFGITNIQDTDLDTLFSYIPTGGLSERDGGIGTGNEFWNEDVLANTELTDIEIRFGPGLSQKAYMFAAISYDYKNFVDVPFEVWDTKNNIQLACSFLDVYSNNKYYLGDTRGDIIFVNNIPYDTIASSDIAQFLGIKFENLFVVAFKMELGKSWDPDNLPNVKLSIEVGNLTTLKRSTEAITDGYNKYPTDTYAHVDHHNITLFPTNDATQEFIFLNGNDGGIAVSYDAGASFTEVGDNGYNTSQFYGVDKKPGGSQYFGGMQDNGTWESAKNVEADKTTPYKYLIGGDGFEVSWHYTDPLKMIGGSQFNRFRKTVDGGLTFYNANEGFNGWGNSSVSPFISKIAKSYSAPDLLYTITKEGVYKSENFGDSWSLIPISAFASDGYFNFAQVAISIAEPQVVWAGAYSNSLFVSKDGGLSFNIASDNTFIPNTMLSGFNTHPTNEATAFATYSISDSPKILKTNDYGQSWQDISGFGTGSVSTNGFPNVATYCVTVMPYKTDIIWAGTDIGIIESTDGGSSWHLADNGLPQVAIWKIRIVDDQVVVATHGRGIWSVSLPELADHKPPVATIAPTILSAEQKASNLLLNISLRSVYDSTNIVVYGQNILTLKSSNIVDTLVEAQISNSGTITVYLESFNNSRSYKSASLDVEVIELLETQLGYSNSFDSGNGDFFSDGFTVSTNSGFSSFSLNSKHPYPDLTTSVAVLRVPIVVAASKATLQYDDIAIIESGEAGTVFGDFEFWDYVIVEANNSGEWITLQDGYDSRIHSDWETAYNESQAGTEAMYKTHIINLLDKFSAGDTLIIRFKLFADELTNGWGWSIDNLLIQGQFVEVAEEVVTPAKFSLSQNYPNPFNPSTKISFSLPTESKVSLQVFNTLGEKITTLVNENENAGVYSLEWNASNLASGVYLYKIHAKAISGDEEFNVVKKMILMK